MNSLPLQLWTAVLLLGGSARAITAGADGLAIGLLLLGATCLGAWIVTHKS